MWHNTEMAVPTTEANRSAKGELSVSQLIDEIERVLADSPKIAGRSGIPNLPAAREAAGRMFDAIAQIGSRVRKQEEIVAAQVAGQVGNLTLLRSFAAFSALVRRQPAVAAFHLVDAWLDEARIIGAEGSGKTMFLATMRTELSDEAATRSRDRRGSESAVPESSEWLVLFSQAAEEVIARSWSEGQARTALRSLMTHLDLGQDELGRLFGVSGETVRRWERGKSRISSGSEAAILAVDSAARRLLEIFRPGRLALVLRRKAELFEGETALEWILRGRVDEVVERYERTFLYQA